MKKLKILDLIIFTAIAIISDWVAYSLKLFNLNLIISLSIPIIIIIYIRWSYYGIITNVLVTISHFIIFQEPPLNKLIHSISFLFLGLSLLFLLLKSYKDLPIKKRYLTLLYIPIYAVMMLVEWGLSHLTQTPISLIGHIANHSLNFIIGLAVILVASIQPNIIVSMKSYEMHLIKTKTYVKDDGYGI